MNNKKLPEGLVQAPVVMTRALTKEEQVALPGEVHFSPRPKQGLNHPESYYNDSLASVLKKVEIADDAFLNSCLAYCVYADNLWTITEMEKPLEEMTVHVQKALNDKSELYNLKMWHFNKNFFEKIPDYNFSIRAGGSYKSDYGFMVNYEYLNGQYSALDDLAHATVLKSRHPSGEGYVLNLSFRGTEFSRLPAFILKAYPDMSAYYENFKPLEKAIMEYARNPENNIKEIQVSGHSLGGAMVQEFLKNNPAQPNDPVISGFTFGSPGSKKHFLHKMVTMTYHMIVNQKIVWDNEPGSKDNRLNEFYHSNDPVPRIGMLGYSTNGNMNNLFDKVYEDSQKANLEEVSVFEKIPAFGKLVSYFKENVTNKLKVRFHDSKRYTWNIRSLIEEHFKLYPHLTRAMKDKTQYWQEFCYQENAFKGLTIKYKSAFETLLKNENPNMDSKAITDKVLKMREEMKYDSEASLVLSRKLAGDSSYQQYISRNIVPSNQPADTAEKVKALREKYHPVLEERAKMFKHG
jgi:hypothetical protein